MAEQASDGGVPQDLQCSLLTPLRVIASLAGSVGFLYPCLLEPCGGRGPLAFSFSSVLSFCPSVSCECDLHSSSKVQKPNEKEMNVCTYICTSADSIVMFGQYHYPGEKGADFNLLTLVFGFAMSGSAAIAYGRVF